jgi:2,3-bisphosphoglycerate-independent phosphoglycerate mutase
MLLTADHGNCEIMWDDEASSPHTAHSYNPVPIYLIGGGSASLRDGGLSDLAPTLLTLLGLDIPPEMTGSSLLI